MPADIRDFVGNNHIYIDPPRSSSPTPTPSHTEIRECRQQAHSSPGPFLCPEPSLHHRNDETLPNGARTRIVEPKDRSMPNVKAYDFSDYNVKDRMKAASRVAKEIEHEEAKRRKIAAQVGREMVREAELRELLAHFGRTELEREIARREADLRWHRDRMLEDCRISQLEREVMRRREEKRAAERRVLGKERFSVCEIVRVRAEKRYRWLSRN